MRIVLFNFHSELFSIENRQHIRSVRNPYMVSLTVIVSNDTPFAVIETLGVLPINFDFKTAFSFALSLSVSPCDGIYSVLS